MPPFTTVTPGFEFGGVYLNVDGTRIVEEKQMSLLHTALSYLDHYILRPATGEFESATLFHFVQHLYYTMPSQGVEPKLRKKRSLSYVHTHRLILTVLTMSSIVMFHRPFRDEQKLLDGM